MSRTHKSQAHTSPFFFIKRPPATRQFSKNAFTFLERINITKLHYAPTLTQNKHALFCVPFNQNCYSFLPSQVESLFSFSISLSRLHVCQSIRHCGKYIWNTSCNVIVKTKLVVYLLAFHHS